MAEEKVHSVGKRKSAVARVWMKPGTGTITVNRKPIEEYVRRETDRILIRQPLTITDNVEKFDISVTVRGGGISGQGGGIRVCRRLSPARTGEHTCEKPRHV